MANSASRKSSDNRRTACTPGSTSVPFPVTILKPRLSATPSGVFEPQPEITRAWFGSATRQATLKRMIRRTTPIATPIRTDMLLLLQPRLHPGDDDGSWREVLDHDDAAAGLDGVVALRGIGVKSFAFPLHGDHHLPQLARGDGAGHPAHLPDHHLVGQRRPSTVRSITTRRGERTPPSG